MHKTYKTQPVFTCGLCKKFYLMLISPYYGLIDNIKEMFTPVNKVVNLAVFSLFLYFQETDHSVEEILKVC